MQDQDKIEFRQFMGLFSHADEDAVPPDHFSDAKNLLFGTDPSNVRTRPGIKSHLTLTGIRRIRQYKRPFSDNRILILTDGGNLYDSTNLITPILQIDEMTDFALVNLFDNAYISPHNGDTGLEDEVVYIYDGTTIRAAGGEAPNGFDLTLSLVAQTAVGTDIVAPVAPANGAQTLTTDPYVPNIPCAIKFNLTGGTITAMNIIVTGIDSGNDIVTKTYEDKVLSAGPANYTTPEIWRQIDDITLSNVTGAGGTFKVETTGSPNGKVERGYHVVGIVYETVTGFLTKPGPESNLSAILVNKNNRAIKVEGIPAAPGSEVAKIHVVASKFIKKKQYSGNPDPAQYEMFFVPKSSGGELPVGTESTVINFFDVELLESADYLLDTLSEIPAAVCLLATSKGRLITGGEFDNPSVIRGSRGGEPENFSATDGFVIVKPGDACGGVKNLCEYRDLIEIYKEAGQGRTYITEDTGDLLSTWQINLVDNSIGTSPNGISRVLESEADTFDTILVADKGGLQAFSGTYGEQDLSWKIKDQWDRYRNGEFNRVEVVVEPKTRSIFVLFTSGVEIGINTPTNLLTNGDAEEGDTSGWTVTGTVTATNTSPVYEGVYSFLYEDGSQLQECEVPGDTVITVQGAVYANEEHLIGIRIYLVEEDLYLNPDGVTWQSSPVYWNETEGQSYQFEEATPTTPSGGPHTLRYIVEANIFGRSDAHAVIIEETPTFASLLLYADYSLGLDWKNIRWCPWELPYTPMAVLTEIDQTTGLPSVKIATANEGIFKIDFGDPEPSKNDNTTETIPNYFETFKATFSSAGGMSHCAGVRMKISGFGDMVNSFIGANGDPLYPVPVDVPLNLTGTNVLIPANIVSEDISFRLEIDQLEGYFELKQLWIFGTELWVDKSDSLDFSMMEELVESWELSEVSGNRTGIHAALVLTDFGSVGSDVGVDGEVAAEFVRASNQYLTRALSGLSDPLILTDGSFSLSMWVYFNTLPTVGQIFSLLTGSQNQYQLLFNFATAGLTVPRFDFGYYSDAGFTLHRVHTGTTIFAVNTWYLVNCSFDFDTLEMKLQVNESRIFTNTGTLPPATPVATNFRLGTDFAGANRFDGIMQYMRIWRRVLNIYEWEWLYNNGEGRPYEDLTTHG